MENDSLEGNDEIFLSRFFLTKIFKNFVIRKYLNNDIDKFIFLHFDETILSKKNRSFFSRKIKTEFAIPIYHYYRSSKDSVYLFRDAFHTKFIQFPIQYVILNNNFIEVICFIKHYQS